MKRLATTIKTRKGETKIIYINVDDKTAEVLTQLNDKDYEQQYLYEEYLMQNRERWYNRKNISLDKMIEKGFELYYTSNEFEEIIEKQSEKNKLLKAIKNLTLSQQELVERIYYNNEKQKDIAEELGITPAAITKANAELSKLKEEIVKALMGTSVFPEATIKELLIKKENEITNLRLEIEEMTKEITDKQAKKEAYLEIDDTLANWDERFDAQDFEGQRIMLSNVIDRINVFNDSAEIVYNIELRAYNSGIKNIITENAEFMDMQCTTSAV